MYKNLFGELVFEPIDIANFVLNEREFSRKYRLLISPQTKMGFSLHSNFEKAPILSDESGLYAIYRNDDLFYIGATMNSIHQRIARFVKEVRGLSTWREDHAAAKKFRKLYGERDLDKLYISAIRIKPPHYMDIRSVEKELINIMKPIGNEKV